MRNTGKQELHGKSHHKAKMGELHEVAVGVAKQHMHIRDNIALIVSWCDWHFIRIHTYMVHVSVLGQLAVHHSDHVILFKYTEQNYIRLTFCHEKGIDIKH